MTVALILVIVAFCGVAMELGRLYNRKVELQTLADTVALAAAAKLNGTSDGIGAARTAAEQAASITQYAYTTANVEWSEDAIRFGTAPDGVTWLDAEAAALPANAAKLFFVRVDTSKLDARHGNVVTLLLRVFPSLPTSIHVSSVATAGRSSINVMPLAICALSENEAETRGTELVEHGFRRGVSYNLMKLNPNDDEKGANYLVNPVSLPGANATSVMGRMDVVRPFVCTGTLAIPTLAGDKITVERDFPLGSLYQQLNSRFGSYVDPCISDSAPPDSNIKQFDYLTAFPWMNSAPTEQSAESRKHNDKLITVADIPQEDIDSATTGGMYGPLWVYDRAVVKDSKYVAGKPEPVSGYTKFISSDWPALYNQSVKTGYSYPLTPYTTQIQVPAGLKGVAHRRVLNVPLLRCPVPTGSPTSADVLAIGKFFMTVRATDTALHAEFAGLAHPSSLSGRAELYP